MTLFSLSHNVHQDPANYGNIKDIDANLITDLREKGDMEAFTVLMNKYKKPVLNFCYRYTGNREDAEDISQDIFIKVFNNIRSFRGESKFTTWLYRLAVNTCLNHKRWYRSERLDEMVSLTSDESDEESGPFEIKDPAPDPEHALLNKELGVIIDSSVCRLNKKQRSVLILKDFGGRSYEEISEIMNMNMGTVKSVLSRGRMNVAIKIKEYYKQ